jgi:hypothetical protein
VLCEEFDCSKCEIYSLLQTSLSHIIVHQAIIDFNSSSPKQLFTYFYLTSLRSSPDTTLSRYDISWMPSYVSLPSCLLSTCRISVLRLCWISGCSASSYRAKLRVLPEVSNPLSETLTPVPQTSLRLFLKKQNEVLLKKKLAMSSCYVQLLFRTSLFLCFRIHFVLRIF